MSGPCTSTMLWEDVPSDQRETPAAETRAMLALARPQDRRAAIEADILRPIFRESLRRWQRSEQESACPMATRTTYDKAKRHWLYRPCGNTPAPGERFCWRHGGKKKPPSRH